MSGRIFLICEDENDTKVVQCLIDVLGFSVKVIARTPSSATPGISRLAAELISLVATARKEIRDEDCIAVLHDNDQKQPDRSLYDSIYEQCKREKVNLIVATDNIESWLLSDSGISKWLNITRKTWNSDTHSKTELIRLMNDRYKLKYSRYLEKVLDHAKADSTNQSFIDALKKLQNAPCVKGS